MTHFRLLEVPLNPEQVASYGNELSQACIKYGEVNAERKKINSEYNDKLKELQKTIDTLSANIQNGFEEKDVECDERLNKKDQKVEIIRLDSMAVVETRDIESEDLQEDLLEGEGEENERDDTQE